MEKIFESEEDESVMGKYSINTEKEVKLDYVKTRMLVSIANELAEANRLKRLELCLLQHTSGLTQKTIEDIFDHDRELEDQA